MYLENSYLYCSSQYDYLDWAFYHLNNYINENDDYIKLRIESAIKNLKSANEAEKKGDYDDAIHFIKKVIPSVDEV